MNSIEAAIICDDIRREANGKDILIGVYSGDILVPIIPFQILLAFWVEWIPPKTGRLDLYFRVLFSDEQMGRVKIEVTISEVTNTAIHLPGLLIAGMKEGEVVMEYSLDGQEWTFIKRKKVRKGPMPSFVPSPATLST